jgi:hypothetical protein
VSGTKARSIKPTPSINRNIFLYLGIDIPNGYFPQSHHQVKNVPPIYYLFIYYSKKIIFAAKDCHNAIHFKQTNRNIMNVILLFADFSIQCNSLAC